MWAFSNITIMRWRRHHLCAHCFQIRYLKLWCSHPVSPIKKRECIIASCEEYWIMNVCIVKFFTTCNYHHKKLLTTLHNIFAVIQMHNNSSDPLFCLCATNCLQTKFLLLFLSSTPEFVHNCMQNNSHKKETEGRLK